MKKIFALTALLALAACASPQEQCIADASANYNAVQSQISVAEGNITRGYAVHTSQVPYTYTGICYDYSVTPSREYECEKTSTRTNETPVAIDVNAERAKINQLKARLPGLRAAMNAAIAQCRATYPE